MPAVKKHSAQGSPRGFHTAPTLPRLYEHQKTRGYSNVSVHACVHVVYVCMPLWVLHNINEADLCVAVLPKALAYTLTCIPSPPVSRNQQCLTAEPGVGSCAHFSP